MLPVILLSPLGGILADRANRRNIMVGLDVLSGLVVVAMLLFFRQHNAIFTIGAALVALSVLGAFESPTVQACVPQMHTGNNIVRANAVINQVAAISAMVAPILGSVLYTAMSLARLLPLCAACFFLTAGLECFIRLPHQKSTRRESILAIIRADFAESFHFIIKKQPAILKILLLAAATNFFCWWALAWWGCPFGCAQCWALEPRTMAWPKA